MFNQFKETHFIFCRLKEKSSLSPSKKYNLEISVNKKASATPEMLSVFMRILGLLGSLPEFQTTSLSTVAHSAPRIKQTMLIKQL